jgi:hypothetical protein
MTTQPTVRFKEDTAPAHPHSSNSNNSNSSSNSRASKEWKHGMRCTACNTNLGLLYHQHCLQPIFDKLLGYVAALKKNIKKREKKKKLLQRLIEEEIETVGVPAAIAAILFTINLARFASSSVVPPSLLLRNTSEEEKMKALNILYHWKPLQPQQSQQLQQQRQRVQAMARLLMDHKAEREKLRQEVAERTALLKQRSAQLLATATHMKSTFAITGLATRDEARLLLQANADALSRMREQLAARRREHLATLLSLLPIVPVSDRMYSVGPVGAFLLPADWRLIDYADVDDDDDDDDDDEDDDYDHGRHRGNGSNHNGRGRHRDDLLDGKKMSVERIDAGIGLLAFVVDLIARYWGFALPFSIKFMSSRSRIYDCNVAAVAAAAAAVDDGMRAKKMKVKYYPLYFGDGGGGKSGLALLALDVVALCHAADVPCESDAYLLKNLCSFIGNRGAAEALPSSILAKRALSLSMASSLPSSPPSSATAAAAAATATTAARPPSNPVLFSRIDDEDDDLVVIEQLGL